MKNIFKKFQILLLALFIISGCGASSVIAKEQFSSTTGSSYILSSYYPRRDTIQSIYSYQPQNTTNTINLPANTEKSSNWAGYIATPTSKDNAYTSISGNWTVPSISSNYQNASAAQWIGLGGVDSEDLLQMGTIEEIKNGQPVAEVFWEKLPDVAQNIISIPIGSSISVTISKATDSKWNLTFTATTPEVKTITKTISTTLDSSYEQGIGTSAEWISEDPSDQYSQLLPLANTDKVKYQSMKVNGNSPNNSSSNVSPVAMVSKSGNIAIYPSEIGADGESFTATTNSSDTSNINSTPSFRHRPDSLPRHISRYPAGGYPHYRQPAAVGY
ncbi:G1 family glutamic endopeptidase [Clostridium sp. LBM24168]